MPTPAVLQTIALPGGVTVQRLRATDRHDVQGNYLVADRIGTEIVIATTAGVPVLHCNDADTLEWLLEDLEYLARLVRRAMTA
jgi:hypothetical protein